ncbi:MAG: hypothetical protein EOO61_12065 [Hymenobacter sp.]|nr:MAG: hypothetical protein EOO61_12065 [Hymenobacter sp.]
MASSEGTNINTVYSVVHQYHYQTSVRSLPRSGRPPILSKRFKRRIFCCIASNYSISNQDIIVGAELPCSAATLQRFLLKHKIQHYRALRRPKLTLKNAEQRLAWCVEHVEKPLDFWRKLL